MLSLLANKNVAIVAIVCGVLAFGFFMYKSHINSVIAQATIVENNKTLKQVVDDLKDYNEKQEKILESQRNIEAELQANKEDIQESLDNALKNIDNAPDKDKGSSQVLRDAVKSLQGLNK